MERILPALAAVAPGRILELLRLAGFEVVVAPAGADLTAIEARRTLLVQRDGSVVG